MGKRKLHGTTFFQCDWTGFPMKSTNCFLPSWHGNDKDTGKMTKKASTAIGSLCSLTHSFYVYQTTKRVASGFVTLPSLYTSRLVQSIFNKRHTSMILLT